MSKQRNWQPWRKSEGMQVVNWPTGEEKQLYTLALGLDIPQHLVGTPTAERLLAMATDLIQRAIEEDEQVAEQMQSLNIDYVGIVVEKC